MALDQISRLNQSIYQQESNVFSSVIVKMYECISSDLSTPIWLVTKYTIKEVLTDLYFFYAEILTPTWYIHIRSGLISYLVGFGFALNFSSLIEYYWVYECDCDSIELWNFSLFDSTQYILSPQEWLFGLKDDIFDFPQWYIPFIGSQIQFNLWSTLQG